MLSLEQMEKNIPFILTRIRPQWNHTFARTMSTWRRYIFGPFNLLFKLYMLLVFFVVWMLFYPIVFYFLNDASRHPTAFKIKVLWCRVLALLMFTRFKIEGKEHLNFDGPCVVCINHQSYMDIIYMYPVIPHYFKFIGKKELRSWLMIGPFFKKGMDISVNRANAMEARKSLDEAMAALREGISVAIFPEGEIPVDTPQLKRFKNGAFKMALETQTAVLPVTFLHNHHRLHEPFDLLGRCTPGTCEVVIHPRIETQGMDLMDIAPVRNKVYEVINGPLVARGYSKSPNFASNGDQ